MNTGFSEVFGVCVHGFRARGLRPRPGMTRLHFKLSHYPIFYIRIVIPPKDGLGPRVYGALSPAARNAVAERSRAEKLHEHH